MYSQAILIKKWTLTLLCLSLIACGSSKKFDVPEGIKDTTPPKIENIYPDEDSSNNFEVDYKVELIFSELMNQNSLIEEKGVSLFAGKTEQDSSVELEPRDSLITLSVLPFDGIDLATGQEIQIPATKLLLTHASGRFALNTNYTVIVENPARDLVEDDITTEDIDERNYIASSNVFDFTTEEGEWKSSTAVPNIAIQMDLTTEKPIILSSKQFLPKVISNKNGDTFILWLQEISSGLNQLWITRYDANSKQWTLIDKNKQICENLICANSTQISTNNSTSVLEYDVAINDKGQLAVVWSQAALAGGNISIWAKLYDGEQWLGLEEIGDSGFIRTNNENADSPQVGIDKKGNVVSIWREHKNNNANSRITMNIYRLDNNALSMSEGAWIEAPSYIDNSSQTLSNSPKLKISKDGLAIAVWSQKLAEDYQIYSNHIRLSQSEEEWDWVGPERIDMGLGRASLPVLAIDQNNDAIAIWLKHDGQRNNLWYSRFVGSWGESDFVERDRLGDAAYPIITFSHDNRALVAWTQENKTTNVKKLLVSFFDVNIAGSWESQQEIASSSNLLKPTASFDREGNAVVMWQEGLTTGKINTSYYSKISKNWNDAKLLSATGKDVSIAPLFEDGRFLSVWESEVNSDFKINSALYSD